MTEEEREKARQVFEDYKTQVRKSIAPVFDHFHEMTGHTLQLAIGLREQGHLPTVERMLAEGKTWEVIGAVIGWNPDAARFWYLFEKSLTEG